MIFVVLVVFVTSVIFAGFVIASSFQSLPGSDVCISATGQALLYVFDVRTGLGYFDDGTSDVAPDRYLLVGGGMPSKPKISTGTVPGDDVVYIKTSSGQVDTTCIIAVILDDVLDTVAALEETLRQREITGSREM